MGPKWLEIPGKNLLKALGRGTTKGRRPISAADTDLQCVVGHGWCGPGHNWYSSGSPVALLALRTDLAVLPGLLPRSAKGVLEFNLIETSLLGGALFTNLRYEDC